MAAVSSLRPAKGLGATCAAVIGAVLSCGSVRFCSSVHAGFAAVGGPFGVIGPLGVHALVGVGTEVVALALDQGGGQPFGTHLVQVGHCGGEPWNGDSGLCGGAEHAAGAGTGLGQAGAEDRKSTRLNSSHVANSYAVFCLKKKI